MFAYHIRLEFGLLGIVAEFRTRDNRNVLLKRRVGAFDIHIGGVILNGDTARAVYSRYRPFLSFERFSSSLRLWRLPSCNTAVSRGDNYRLQPESLQGGESRDRYRLQPESIQGGESRDRYRLQPESIQGGESQRSVLPQQVFPAAREVNVLCPFMMNPAPPVTRRLTLPPHSGHVFNGSSLIR
jgi:hypothetical protein